jgi:nucleoside-diphosphate-sugar epimerase
MKAFVVGATGYVGSHVARRLLEAGFAVTGLSRNEKGDEALVKLGVAPIRGDAEAEDVINAAARDADATIFAPQLLLEPEQKAVLQILAALEGSGKTFIFTSGTGVLAQRTNGDWSEDTFTEDEPFVPHKPLLMRVQTEELVRLAGKQRGVRAMVIRPPMIWGDRGCVVLGQIHASLKKTGAACYIGAGLNLYSNVHVFDVAEVFALAVMKGTAGSLYHAVSGEMSFRALAEMIAQRAGATARSVSTAEADEIWGKFFSRIVFSVCSRSRSPKTRTELGWVPRYLDLGEMLGCR